ncbi:hypothetical protein PR048_019440 [Dryococelus australis]|uniref:Uncharacterized protein n=1 Tax=Dryococelus australis TaxID=614101 RepID=A0ABQ9H3H6_9NEOP|nr:hypothetical protein PR048_019440 [Dryococelus australis]
MWLKRGENGATQRRNERVGKMGDPRENPPTSGTVRHDSHMLKSGVNPAGNHTRFALVAESLTESRKLQQIDSSPHSCPLSVVMQARVPTRAAHDAKCVISILRRVSEEIWAALYIEVMRANEEEGGEYGAAPKFKYRGNERFPRKPANQWHTDLPSLRVLKVPPLRELVLSVTWRVSLTEYVEQARRSRKGKTPVDPTCCSATVEQPSFVTAYKTSEMHTCSLSVVQLWSMTLNWYSRIADTGIKGRGKQKIPEQSCRPTASSGTLHTYENSRVNWPGIEPGSPWWEASSSTAQPPRPHL